jgi:hypothetical protein
VSTNDRVDTLERPGGGVDADGAHLLDGAKVA